MSRSPVVKSFENGGRISSLETLNLERLNCEGETWNVLVNGLADHDYVRNGPAACSFDSLRRGNLNDKVVKVLALNPVSLDS